MPQDTCIIEFTTAAARRRRSQCQADRREVWTKPKAFATAAWPFWTQYFFSHSSRLKTLGAST